MHFLFYIQIEKGNSFLKKIVSNLGFFKCRVTSRKKESDITLYFFDISQMRNNLLFSPEINRNITISGPWHYKCPEKNQIIACWGMNNPSRAVIDIDKRQIRFFISPYHWARPVLVPIRFIKGAIYLLLLHSGIYTFHSSCLANDKNEAYMFLAPSGHGKSTVLRHLLRYGFKWIADDQVFLKSANNKIWAFSIFNQMGRNNDINLALMFGEENSMKAGAFLKSVLFVSISHSDVTTISPLSRAEAKRVLGHSRQFLNPAYLESDSDYMKQLYNTWSTLLINTCSFFRMECGKDVWDNSSRLYTILRDAEVF